MCKASNHNYDINTDSKRLKTINMDLFIKEHDGLFKVDLSEFDKERLEILRNHICEKNKATDLIRTVYFANGNAPDCNLINELIAVDFVYLNIDKLVFSKCRFSVDSIRAILRLGISSR